MLVDGERSGAGRQGDPVMGCPAQVLRSYADELVAAAARDLAGHCGPEPVPEAPQAQLLDDLRRTVWLVADTIEGQREPDQAERAAFSAAAVSRLGDGLPLLAVLSGHRLVLDRAWRFLDEVGARRGGAAEVTVSAVFAALRLVEELAATLTTSFLEQHDRQLMTCEQARRALLDRLLGGAFLSDEEINDEGSRFGYDFDRPHAVLMIASGGPDRRARAERRRSQAAPLEASSVVRRAVDDLTSAMPRAAVVDPGGPIAHATVLVSCAAARDWPAVRSAAAAVQGRHDVLILAAGPVAGAGRLAAAYAEARQVLPLAMLVSRRPGIVDVDDLLVYRVLTTDARHRQRFLDAVIGPLLALAPSRRAPFVEALQAYYDADGDVEAASEAMHVHVNTVRYRLRRIEELTGCSVRNPHDQLRLYLALHALVLSQAAQALDGGAGD